MFWVKDILNSFCMFCGSSIRETHGNYTRNYKINTSEFYITPFVEPGWHYSFRKLVTRVLRLTEALRWRHNGPDSVSNHQPHDCLLNRLFRHRSKKTSKLRVTGLCAGNSPGTGEFPAQMASYAENVSIWWRHHGEFSQAGFCADACHHGTDWNSSV